MPRWQTIRNTILTHKVTRFIWQAVKRTGIASESPASFAVIALLGIFLLVLLNLRIPTERIPETPETQTDDDQAQVATIETPPPVYVPAEESFKLRRGETLTNLLHRATIDRKNAFGVISYLKKVTNLRRLQTGQNIRLVRQGNNGRNLAELRIRDRFAEEAVVRYEGGKYKAQRTPIETYALTHFVTGRITDSLYLSAKRAGLPEKVIIDLIRMMSFDVDFEREIRVGDQFDIYFERDYSPAFDDIENGQILYAKLTMQKRVLEAYFYRDKDGNVGYYDAKGRSTRRALMKTPLDVAVLTSSYGARKHPVLGYTRMHKGSDFRAPTGTPIMAAGDGIIEMAARNGSFGNYIRIRHTGSYKTAYAHLSRFGKGIKKGARVKQGQIIGLSGATGRVSGAHLHYEVLVDGKQVNPMLLKLPTGRKLTGTDLKALRIIYAQTHQDIANIFATQTAVATSPADTAIFRSESPNQPKAVEAAR